MNNLVDQLELPWELNPIWDVLTQEQKQEISQRIELVHYKKHDIIRREGETPTHMMMLISGKVRIYKEGNSMRPQIIRMLKPHDIFGYRAIFGGDQHNTSASAFEPCEIMMLDKETFLHMVQVNSDFCFAILRKMAGDLAHSELQTVNLTQKHIRGRLAEAILKLKNHYGLEADGRTIAIQIGREDLANMSNMTTSNAIRTLSQFAQEGLLEINGKNIIIIDEYELDKTSRMG